MSADSETEFQRRLAEAAARTDAMLAEVLSPPKETATGHEAPERLLAAMRHGVLNGGKRMRPFFVLETARLLGAPETGALHVAAALECIHCYSLIHDDLPAMDDDDLRRGQPTVHVAFDEATAILAGDALLTLAFEIVAGEETGLPSATRCALAFALARAAGPAGMVGGQTLDIAAETAPPDAQGIRRLQAMKTGALIAFACEAGAIIADAPPHQRAALRAYGERLGEAYQLSDDLLDVTGSARALGKAAAKDAGRGKGTLVALNGIDWAKADLQRLVGEAVGHLSAFGDRASVLAAAARFVALRDR